MQKSLRQCLWYPGQQICLSAECDQVPAKDSHQHHPRCHLLSQSHVHEISCAPECRYGPRGLQQKCDTWRIAKMEHLGTGAAVHSWQQRKQGRETAEGVPEALSEQCHGKLTWYRERTQCIGSFSGPTNPTEMSLTTQVVRYQFTWLIDWLTFLFNLGSTLSEILFSVAEPLIHHLHTFIPLYIQYIHILLIDKIIKITKNWYNCI